VTADHRLCDTDALYRGAQFEAFVTREPIDKGFSNLLDRMIRLT